MATGRTIRPGLAIDVPGLRKTCPGGVEAVGGIDFTVQPGEPLRSARPERRRQADDDRELTTTIVLAGGRRSWPGSTSSVNRSPRGKSAASCARKLSSTEGCPARPTSACTPGCGASAPTQRGAAAVN